MVSSPILTKSWRLQCWWGQGMWVGAPTEGGRVGAGLLWRRQVELAKTLVGGPRVILLDEPCAGLNDSETDAFRTLLQAIHAEYGAQVILIDHDADLIAAACHETLVIDFGHRLAMGPTAEVLQNDDVRRAYLGTM